MTNGERNEYINYYTKALTDIKEAGLNPDDIVFFTDGEYFEASMMVSEANTMTNREYYNQTVFNKGQLISFKNGNARKLDDFKNIHADYIKDLEDDIKTKLHSVHQEKIKPFVEINHLLDEAINTLEQEELKYKPAKKQKMK